MDYFLNEKLINTGNPVKDILFARGIDDVENYLTPQKDSLYPFEGLKNIDEAAACLLKHLKRNSKIYLVVDCDNDGITSAAELYLYIKKIFPEANIYWTMHDGKQHGIELKNLQENTDLVLLPDAGSNQLEEHKILKEMGIDVIVLDHHEAVQESKDAIIVNNQMCDYPNKTLSGAGVVWKFLQKMDNLLSVNYANQFLDLAAVGIIGDMMDLQDFETRYIVEEGLKNINNPGLKYLIEKQSYSIGGTISPIAISFYICPLLNAIIRVGTMEEKEVLFKGFIEGNETTPSTKRGHKIGDLETFSEQAGRFGTNCRNRQKKILEEAVPYLKLKIEKEDLDSNKILFIALDALEANKIPPELSGLIAMKIVSDYGKPTIVVRETEEGILGGSIRGLNNSDFNDFKKFLNESGYFIFAEGHANAAGCKIKSKMVNSFLEYANEKLKSYTFTNSYVVDYIFDENDFDFVKEFAFAVESLKEIWGKGIEKPVIAFKDLQFSIDQVKAMGEKGNTGKIQKGGISFIKFKDSKFVDEITKYDFATIDLIGETDISYYGGKESVQIIITDYEVKKDNSF